MNLNNSKYNYARKFKAILKYVLFAFPIILLLIISLTPLKNADGGDITTDTHTEYTINYGHTNNVFLNNDLIVNNYYKVDIKQITNDYGDTNQLDGLRTDNYFDMITFNVIGCYNAAFDFQESLSVDEYIYESYYSKYYTNFVLASWGNFLQIGNDNVYTCFPFSNLNMLFDNSLDSYIIIQVLSYDITQSTTGRYIYSCPQDYLPLESVTQQTIEGTRYNYDLVNGFVTFYESDINSWYGTFLSAFSLDFPTTSFIYHLVHMPLWIMYVVLLDLLLDIVLLVPCLLHNLVHKYKGDD